MKAAGKRMWFTILIASNAAVGSLLTQTLLLWKLNSADSRLVAMKKIVRRPVSPTSFASVWADRIVVAIIWCERARVSRTNRRVNYGGSDRKQRGARCMRPRRHYRTPGTGSPWLLGPHRAPPYTSIPSKSQVNGLHRSRPWCLFSRYDIRQPNDVIRLDDCVNWFYLCRRGRFANWIRSVYWNLFVDRVMCFVLRAKRKTKNVVNTSSLF